MQKHEAVMNKIVALLIAIALCLEFVLSWTKYPISAQATRAALSFVLSVMFMLWWKVKIKG